MKICALRPCYHSAAKMKCRKSFDVNLILKAVTLFLICDACTAAGPFDCPNLTIHWWQTRPYAYKNETGGPVGIYPLLFNEAAKYCCKSLSINWDHTYLDYKDALEDIESIDFSEPSNKSSVDVWLPFSLLNIDNITELQVIDSTQLIMIVQETKLDKLKIVYAGFKSIAPQILMILLLTILFGILIWIVETKSNTQFPAPFPRGAWHGFWWAIVTVTTVGYGDKSPKTGFGKFIGIVWMITGLVLFPVLTAEVTSILTDTSYSLLLKKAGVLKQSKEIRFAIDRGALVHECDSYTHCLKMLQDGVIDVALLDVHVAMWLDEEKTLVNKGHITAKVPIAAFVRNSDDASMSDFFECMRKNSSMVTETIKKVQNLSGGKLNSSKGAIFSTATKDVALVLFGVVLFIYFITFAVDTILRFVKKKNKIGNFREGVFMDKMVIKNGSEQQMKEIDDPQEYVKQLIKRHRLQLTELQQNLEEIEKKFEV